MNFFDLDMNRIILHSIIAKEPGQESAQLQESTEIIPHDEHVVYTILERLTLAAEKKTKTFELSIGDHHESSFFGYAQELATCSNEEFISHSVKIGQILANAQISSRFPGGYLIVLDATTHNTGKKVAIVIKAEPQEALTFHENTIHLLENVFLTPTQKFYKFGVIYELEDHQKADLPENTSYPNDAWGCILYDEQFRVDSKPAEYFYKDFLGFSTENNPLIQTKKFYDKTEDFVKRFVDDLDVKENIIASLSNDLSNEANSVIVPPTFLESFELSPDTKEHYKSEIAENLPNEIEKDTRLISSNLNSKKLEFPSNIKLSGPKDSMEAQVEIIKSQEDLAKLSTLQSGYTIIKIAGKPYNTQK
jgi:37-kD nucleoid-associated bacterial protein